MKILKMVIYIFVWILGFVQSDKCYDDLSNGVTGSWFCCNNHEEKNGTCVECEIGYVSKDGYPCQPCSLGLWGRKCRDVCSCLHNERCDIVDGCVEVTTVMSEKLYSTFTEPKDSTYVMTTVDSISATHKKEKWDSTFTEPKESTHVMTTVDSLSAYDKNDGIFLKRELIIYSISAGSIVVMVALGSCCFKYKRKAEHLNKSKSPGTHHEQVPSDQTNVQFNDESSTYESINEDNMICNDTFIRSIIRDEHVNQDDIYLTVDQDVSSSSYSEGDVVDSPNDDYLNPYQQMIEVDVHGYHRLEGESTQKMVEISPGSSASRIADLLNGNDCFQTTDTKPLTIGLLMTTKSENFKNREEKQSKF
ncbi:uncharacterized protein LOC127726241 [Mytilus californianus]|uniref:uncharacterized protein LOC127726241 n=1 Tax=Mytilus californianus TaxID=6549 RepID=UPI002247D618|nr:uncharacterized protein LOC127726241 [Mytilus californianus]